VTRPLPTGTVTFLFTDVEGSTQLLEDLGAEAYAEALIEHRHLLREAFVTHGGVEVDTQGDAFFFVFADAAAALAAAAAGQASLYSGPIRVRIGVHTGEALQAGGGYVGFDVHKGARVAAAGHGGQIVVSEAARLASGHELRPLGTHRLKDLTAPEPLWQLGEADFPPLSSLNQTNLPVQPTPLIGRERELAEILSLVAGNRLVTLLGPGGSGKTRLALQLAADLVDDFPHGVWWVPLQALRDAELVMPTIGAALGARGDVAEHVAGKRMLLLLDNLEQLLDSAPHLAALLAATNDVTVLVTSREPLRIAGEAVYFIDPLPLDDAVELFRARAAVAEPISAVRDICLRVDSLPLAIELAAARTILLPPTELLARLGHALPVLTGGRRDAPQRQRTLRATIDWSCDLLGPGEQAIFTRLSVFAGSFDLDAAENVCDADIDGLQSLIDKSLLRRGEGEGVRFAYLETVREFALDRLSDLPAGDVASLRQRHASYYRELAERAEPELRGRDQRSWRRRLELDHDNLRAALSWSREVGDAELGLRVGAAVWRFWRTNNYLTEGTRMLDEFLELDDSAPELRARPLLGASRLAMDRGDVARAVARAEEALVAAQAAGVPRDLAAATENLGLMLAVREIAAASQRQADGVQRALALLEEGIDRFRALGDRVGVADALNNLGNALLDFGDRARAAEVLEEALALQREAGDALGLAFVLNTLGYVALRDHELELAGARLDESLGLFRELGDVSRIGDTLEGLAEIAARRGHDRRAATLWGASAALRAESGKQMEPSLSGGILRDEALAEVRTRLGECTFAEAWAEGAALGSQDAIALALSQRPGESGAAVDEALRVLD
jgi:predicted ATPase